MKKHKLLPLSETMHYILLALREPLHGYAMMQKIEEMSAGSVRIAAGTMYGAIENLLKYHWITPVATEDSRRKVYQTTAEGLNILAAEQQRLQRILSLYEGADEHDQV
ncbi:MULTISPECIES: PadR family transcriptional regulator [Lysinibacillus]|uniref:PadR family transcriptional regulator n=1 Tax=Lysinibacillus TaxID=400634 RepID=UPI00088FFF05|nr:MULTISPECIES: PadR family transcriptional regulator [unclassified Lysinibacillus]MEE3806240.1 PadR family transcriptional regulator [Lysinibacillus fusiformis]WCH46020.1 PadR family transcriptional regulator [Lysinibacillus sp. OF-1]SCY30942.1 Transcriptional regulator PadR-like family protein [Lysinibacillus sp. SG9]SDB16668.1 Transcriptional regulator PadR-like family protein [Lysinibacillus sp. TC-37]SFS63359.1 Transcriptional regulator PadR-like family protein [Lysinibacillus sp. SG55]